MRIIALIAGLILGVQVLDEAQAVNFLANLAGTDRAETVAFLGYVFAILTFAGAILAIPAARGASMCFAVSAVLGFYLGATTFWENALVWGFCSLVLSGLSFWGYKRQVRKQEIQAATYGIPSVM